MRSLSRLISIKIQRPGGAKPGPKWGAPQAYYYPPLQSQSHSYKMQSKYFMFTRFAAHGTLDTQEICNTLQPLCTWISFQTEVCPDSGREHIQGYLCLKNRTRLSTFCRTFPCHAELRRGTHAQAVAYTTKEESRKPGTAVFRWGTDPENVQGTRRDLAEFRDAILAGRTNWELLASHPNEFAKYPKFVYLVRTEQLSNDVLLNLPVFQPRIGWQWELAQKLAGIPSRRTVIWRWEPNGNVGKSYFAMHYQPRETFVITGGKHADIHYSYQFQTFVFFDWSRCNESSFPYGLVEQFKNGYFLSTKYESVPKRFQVPHVVVFANFAPDVSQMSLDRWDITEI